MRIGNKTSLLLAVFAAATFCTAGVSEAGKPTLGGPCQKCHTASSSAIRGNLGKVSPGFNTFQVKVGNVVWIVKYDAQTSVLNGDKASGADSIKELPKGKEILISFAGDENNPVATEIKVKQPFKVPEEQKISNDAVIELIAMGPEKGQYTLIDARPGGAFLNGHIPTAISLPFDSFETSSAVVLPQDKNSLLIFYCGGPT